MQDNNSPLNSQNTKQQQGAKSKQMTLLDLVDQETLTKTERSEKNSQLMSKQSSHPRKDEEGSRKQSQQNKNHHEDLRANEAVNSDKVGEHSSDKGMSSPSKGALKTSKKGPIKLVASDLKPKKTTNSISKNKPG